MATIFDEAFYQRHYYDPETRVVGPEEIGRLARFVVAYLEHLGLEVRSVLDIGCGTGLWREALAPLVPELDYRGVEVSDYLCERYGWRKASITELYDEPPADLVVCQGVLQYLNVREAQEAMRVLPRLANGAVYLEVLTREDWQNNCARDRTDGAVNLRSSAWYRKHLHARLIAAGGGVFLPKDTEAVLYELERF